MSLATRIAFYGSILLGIGGWFISPPTGLTVIGWHLLLIFSLTILHIVLAVYPMGAVALTSLTLLVTTNTISSTAAFAGFSHHVVWLLVLALCIAQSFEDTGLGRRLGYWFTTKFGKSSLGLSYGLMLTDLMLAPAIPSVTARAAGIILPIMQGITRSYGSEPNTPSARRIGSFLNVTVFQTTVITSAMFMTAMAANPLITELTHSQGLNLTWGSWALAASVPGLISLILMPLVVYWVYPPLLKKTPDAPGAARLALNEMGPFSSPEKILTFIVLGLLTMWIGGDYFNISSLLAGLLGVTGLILTGVLRWDSILKKAAIWDTFLWFSILLMVATQLNTHGVIPWLSQHIVHFVGDWPWTISFPVLAILYFYIHYFFASSTAHVTVMYLPFIVAAIAVGTPPYLAMFIFIFFSNLFGGLTHYSTTPAPALLGAGFVPLATWWKLGFIVSLCHILIWFTVGPAWWKFLGYW